MFVYRFLSSRSRGTDHETMCVCEGLGEGSMGRRAHQLISEHQQYAQLSAHDCGIVIHFSWLG